MIQPRFDVEGELERLLEQARTIPPASDVVRARAMVRARATVAAAAQSAASDRPAPPIARVRRLHVAVAASVALTLGAAGAIGALRGWTPHHRQLPPNHEHLRPSPAAKFGAPGASGVVVESETKARPKPQPARRASNGLYAAELDLLQRAQAAYVGKDVAGALVVLAEHARRFPNGRFAEEREAIRVQALASAGRADEARRAADGFAARFPRSVLLRRLKTSAQAAE